MSDEYGIGRHVANLFVTQTYEGQSDIHGMPSDFLCSYPADQVTSPDSWESNHWNSGFLLIELLDTIRIHKAVLTLMHFGWKDMGTCDYRTDAKAQT